MDLLRGRGVPLRERECSVSTSTSDSKGGESATEESHLIETNSGSSNCRSALLKEMKLLAMHDRTVLECGSTAFMSFLRAYQEHMCSYIFRFDQLDIGAVARAYALLRLPKIPETRGVKGKPIVFEITNVDTSKIPYLHREQEEARQRRLQAAYEAAEAEDKRAVEEAQANRNGLNNGTNGVEGGGGDEPGTTQFKPHDVFLKKKSKEDKRDRKRKQKGGLHKKIMEDWDDLAAEEMAYKKFKKGHISKEEYDQCLMSDKKLAVDPDTGEPLLVRQTGSESDDGDSGGDGSDDSAGDGDSGSDDDGDADRNKKQKSTSVAAGKSGKKAKMVLQYKDDDSDLSDDDSSDGGKGGKNKGKGGGKVGQKKPFKSAAQGGKDYRRVKSGHSFPGSAGKGKGGKSSQNGGGGGAGKSHGHGGGASSKGKYGGGGGNGGRSRH